MRAARALVTIAWAMLLWVITSDIALAEPLQIEVPHFEGPEQMVPALKMLLLLTVLSLAPAILISMTSFTRIMIVLSMLRQALGAQSVPPLQVITSLSLLFTAVIMTPVFDEINEKALSPYMEKKIAEGPAFEETKKIFTNFMIEQTREKDLELFYEVSGEKLPDTVSDVSFRLLLPAFMISELRTGFEMGFFVFLPFILIDLVVASLLTAMGMVMLPPTMMSIPLKLVLFVAVDGWNLLTRSILTSFG